MLNVVAAETSQDEKPQNTLTSLFGFEDDFNQHGFDKDIGTEGILLLGPLKCQTSCMLFQYAFKHARRGETVLYICSNKEALRATQPYVPLGSSPPTPSVLARVHIRYITSSYALRMFLAWFPHVTSIPGLPELPDCIVIDDLSSFFATGQATHEEISRTMALVNLTMDFVREEKKSDVYVLASCTSCQSVEFPEYQSAQVSIDAVCRRFFRWTVTIAGDHPDFTMTMEESSVYGGRLFRPSNGTPHRADTDETDAMGDKLVYRVDEANKYIILR
ncbi:uncharacterized protein SPPG_02360 [Spizellomyces punctatus DAOM BR117]|uniref:DNA recombination and repair protein Rad51-like C-terminal domain-containing protein n=1 Tax=Spizellomyces punctatus (strain DAOM BR117) TaxID=645134 RepID=A0A0L0HQH3_SPIPD|nr:uncharacterized protein SPPG_02360 [Spizellomyces punctatus DAOM BR117]KND03313.1 hypothetical protein SPPG_02360 [Spizellomyces punctatus DAOM BR117]|eukprot:XP_016611352.1 hypothetical protein SPPG_02360 [Spizellomyces punctatus DAOM BR117]